MMKKEVKAVTVIAECILAGMLIAVQMIMPATGRSVMVSEIVRAIIFWILFIYIDVKVLKKGKKKKISDKGIRIAIVIMSVIFCGWISKGIVMDLIHGPESMELTHIVTEKAANLGVFSMNYQLIGTDENGNKIILKISGDDYSRLSNVDHITVVIYKETGRIVSFE